MLTAVAAGAVWFVWKMATEGDWTEAFIRAFLAGMATFLAWALARELDPDRPWTAGVAGILAASVIGAGPPSLWATAAVMLAARLVSRTTGLAPRRGDLIAMAILAALAGSSDPGLVAGVTLGLVLVADRWLPGGARPISLPFGLAAIAAAVGAAAVWGILRPSPGWPDGPEWLILAVAVIGLASLGRPRSCRAPCDYRDEPVDAARVRWARWTAVAAATLTFVWLGGAGLTAGSAVWAGLAAVALPTIRR
jgi:hypothetical protein